MSYVTKQLADNGSIDQAKDEGFSAKHFIEQIEEQFKVLHIRYKEVPDGK